MLSVDPNVIASIAAAVAAIAAAASAYLLFKANMVSKTVAKEQIAAQAVTQYIDLNLRYPEFSTTKKWERYSNYVFAVLMMSKAILDAYPSDKSWRSLLKEHLSYHQEELRKWKSDVDVFGQAVADLVAEVVAMKVRA